MRMSCLINCYVFHIIAFHLILISYEKTLHGRSYLNLVLRYLFIHTQQEDAHLR